METRTSGTRARGGWVLQVWPALAGETRTILKNILMSLDDEPLADRIAACKALDAIATTGKMVTP